MSAKLNRAARNRSIEKRNERRTVKAIFKALCSVGTSTRGLGLRVIPVATSKGKIATIEFCLPHLPASQRLGQLVCHVRSSGRDTAYLTSESTKIPPVQPDQHLPGLTWPVLREATKHYFES